MLFNSIDFMIFFPVVLSVYFIIPRKLRIIWMLAASYFFYMSWNPQYAILIALSTVITYAGGILVEKCALMECRNRNFWRKTILVSCLSINLLILGIFKYGNFLLESLDTVLQVFGAGMVSRRFDLLLPVGISFYTFQAIGYIIDVYRGDTAAEKNIFYYALFVSFFLQLVAGPIERSGNLLGQMQAFRNYQVTGLEEKFSFSDYFWARIATAGWMAVSNMVYIFYCMQEKGYSRYKAAVILAICFIYAVESVEDVFGDCISESR